jgi:cytosine/adenosine deaminase-related metal-dependent hydrolase
MSGAAVGPGPGGEPVNAGMGGGPVADAGSGGAPVADRGAGGGALVITGCAVATMDGARTEYSEGHLVLRGGRIDAIGAGPARGLDGEATVVDGRGCLATPGLVNTHHHLYQWASRGLAPDGTLFDWLTTSYPVWAGIDEDIVGAAAEAGLAWLALTGCSTTTDHHYVFPAGSGDLLGAEIAAAGRVGLRFHPTRGSMDLGRSAGGLPPDEVVEDIDTVLAATRRAIEQHHDPLPDSMLRIAVAPCSPFSASTDLMAASAELAREARVRLHTHLAETLDEEEFCAERFGCRPAEYMDRLGWLGPDVWFAHSVHLSDSDIALLAGSGTGVAHCPSSNARLGAGIARTRALRDAGVPVGLGVDGAASNESCSLVEEVRHALLMARATGGPQALAVRDALEMATRGGAAVLGRSADIGSLEVGKQADVALWRLDGPGHAGIEDPVAALVLGSAPPVALLTVRGQVVVRDARITTVDPDAATAAGVQATRTLLARAGLARS